MRATTFISLLVLCTALPASADAYRTRSLHASCKPGTTLAAADPKKKGGHVAKTPKSGKDAAPADAPASSPEPAAADKGGPAPKGAGGPSEEEGKTLQRGERVEFDARLIQGQSAKAGAVYLFARVATNLKSMVKERSSFRDKVIRTVYPTEEAKP